jgi:hypothetical protein
MIWHGIKVLRAVMGNTTAMLQTSTLTDTENDGLSHENGADWKDGKPELF